MTMAEGSMMESMFQNVTSGRQVVTASFALPTHFYLCQHKLERKWKAN